jgi:hypothetical protein
MLNATAADGKAGRRYTAACSASGSPSTVNDVLGRTSSEQRA